MSGGATNINNVHNILKIVQCKCYKRFKKVFVGLSIFLKKNF